MPHDALAYQEVAAAVLEWARGKDRFTSFEIMRGCGLNPAHAGLKTRVHMALRNAGWVYKKTYRKGEPNVLTWHCPFINVNGSQTDTGETVQ